MTRDTGDSCYTVLDRLIAADLFNVRKSRKYFLNRGTLSYAIFNTKAQRHKAFYRNSSRSKNAFAFFHSSQRKKWMQNSKDNLLRKPR